MRITWSEFPQKPKWHLWLELPIDAPFLGSAQTLIPVNRAGRKKQEASWSLGIALGEPKLWDETVTHGVFYGAHSASDFCCLAVQHIFQEGTQICYSFAQMLETKRTACLGN